MRDSSAFLPFTAALPLLAVLLTGCPERPTAKSDTSPPAGSPVSIPVNSEATQVAPPANEPGPASSESAARAAKKAGLLADWPAPKVALVLTGQQLGYIEPCGCSGLENQKGGLARRATLIKELKSREWPIVALDVGSQVKRFGKQQEVKFAFAVQGLRAMGYQAMTLGDGDLKLTPGELLAAIAGADGTVHDFVSSNVAVLARELQPTLAVIEAGGKKIGVTAALGEKYEAKLRGDELVHQPPLEALKTVSQELKSRGCDYYVLLAHAPLDEARQLAQAVPEFDLVVCSGETNLPTHELETVEGTKTRLMQVGLKAMYVGIVGLYDDPETPVRFESVPLDARFADAPEMLQLLADYQDRLKEMGLEELGSKPQPHPSGHQFVGSQQCGECHTKAFEVWSKTPHAHAIESLVHPPNSRGSIARHYDPECLSCHVTGWEPQQHFPYVSGYRSLAETPQLKGVGCENCHGPGSAHVAAESDTAKVSAAELAKLRESMRLPLAGSVAERKCLECHDDDNSPEFHKTGAFERYWQRVEHKGKD
jgi:hypothetical protein